MVWVVFLSVVILCFSQTVEVYQTYKYSSDRITRKEDIEFKTRENFLTERKSTENDVVYVELSPETQYQKMFGFGGAITESSIHVMNKMKDELVEEILKSYYIDQKYTIARLHINSCDFSPIGNWSSDNHKDDFELNYFELSQNDKTTIIPFVQRILKTYKPDLKIFASPWSPSWWYKQNLDMLKSSYPNGLKDDIKYYQSWAKYISRWLKEYNENGIKIFAVTPQNEPQNIPRWEACRYTPENLTIFSNILLHVLQDEHKGEVELILHDDQKDTLLEYVPVLLKDKYLNENVRFIGFHWYSGDQFEMVKEIHDRYPDKILLPTEATYTGGIKWQDWERGEGYAHDMIGDFNAFASGWTDWNIILDENGGPNHVGNVCDAQIICDTQKQTLTYQIMFWYMGHFSRFLPEDSRRIMHQIKGVGELEIELTSWIRPDGKVVVVAMNTNEEDIEIRLEQKNKVASTTILKRSIITFVYQNF